MGCAASTPIHEGNAVTLPKEVCSAPIHEREAVTLPKEVCSAPIHEREAVTLPEEVGEAKSFHESYELGEKIGSGSFAEVHSCVHKKTKNVNAVKVFKTPSAKSRSKASRELDVWTQVGAHPNVVALLESYVEDTLDSFATSTYFIMQQCKGSVLDMYNFKRRSLCKGEILKVFHQVFLGLQHCHSMYVVHRDIKASNLLVDFDGVVKLADFGLSVIMPKDEDGVSGIVGSTPYMSPEMVNNRNYGFGTDIWSCAAVMYWLVYEEYPYDAARGLSGDARKKGMMKAIRFDTPRPKHEPADGTKHPAPQVQELIQTLLQRNVEKRPDAQQSAKLVLMAQNESTGYTPSPKAYNAVEHSTESTRYSDAVLSEAPLFLVTSSFAVSGTSSFPVSSLPLVSDRFARVGDTGTTTI